jgi:hypothetical protein
MGKEKKGSGNPGCIFSAKDHYTEEKLTGKFSSLKKKA